MDYAHLFAKILTPIVLPFFKLHVKWKHYKERKYIQDNIIRLKKQNGTYLEEGVFNKVKNLGSVESNVKKLSATVQEHKEDLEGFVPSEVIDLAADGSSAFVLPGKLPWPPPPPKKVVTPSLLQAVDYQKLRRYIKDEPIKPISEAFNDPFESLKRPPIPEPVMNFEEELTLAEKLEMQITGNVRRK